MKLSANFSLREFMCRDGTPVPDPLLPFLNELVDHVLQPIRAAWGAPLIVISGYRTPEHNARIGGAAKSTHMFKGAAGADIQPIFLDAVPNLHALVLDMRKQGRLPRLGGLGEYPNWIHVDTLMAADGHLRRWQGSGMGSER